MMRRQFHIWGLLLLLAIPVAMRGQADRGTITGTVSDSFGAVIESVSVVAVRDATGERLQTATNNLGFYTLRDLPIGNYTVEFSKTGFKDTDRKGIVLQTQHTLQVNIEMQVGSTTETVTVTGTPILEVQTEVGTNMNSQELTDLPLIIAGQGRDITTFAYSVVPNVTSSSGNSWNDSIAGSQNFTKAVMFDGTSTDAGAVGFIGNGQPSMDAVAESQIDTVGLRAEDGRSGGGAFLYELKSGTDQIHGSAFGFIDNEFMNANSWTNKFWRSTCATGDAACDQLYRRPKYRYFDYGFSAGGPVWKKWPGKMYIFGAYEKYLQSDLSVNPTGGTVPTAKMLSGDFSELLSAAAQAHGCATSPCPIMNAATNAPYTDSAGNTIYYGSIFGPGGTVYAGNIISDPISAAASSVVKIYQQHYKPTTAGVANNYPALNSLFPQVHNNQLSFKFDWNRSSNDHIASSYIYNLYPRIDVDIANGGTPSQSLWEQGSTSGGPLTFAVTQTVITNSYRINESHTFSPNLINVLAFTFNAFQNKAVPLAQGDGPTQLGFGSIDTLKDFPRIVLDGAPNGLGETSIGNYYAGGYVSYNGIVNESLAWSKDRHNLKFGAEYRALGFNSDSVGGALNFNFSNQTFAPTDSAIQPYVGSAFANLLLGQVQKASQNVTFTQDSRRKELSFFGQDDIRINSRLTLSADLRWELTRPLHVLYGYWSNFDVNAPSLPYNNLPGAVTWLNHPSDSFETYTDWHQFAPKLGASYQIDKKMVLRASLGLNYVPLGWNGYYGVPYGSAVGYTGVNQVLQVSVQGPAFQWDSGYPGHLVTPTGPQPESSYIPWAPASVDPHTRQLGMIENWFVGLQYELPSNAKLEVSYIGSSGRNLHDGQLNPSNYPKWSTYKPLLNSSHLWDWVWDTGSAQAAGVPYPYPGFSGTTWFAINPYPQVQGNWAQAVAFTNSPLGQSGYNAFTLEGTKQRGSLNLDLSYNWACQTGNTSSAFFDTWVYGYNFQDPYNYKHEATFPHINNTVKGYLTYALPFGQNRKFLSQSKTLDYFVSGWTAGTTVWYSDGTQIGAINSTNYYPGWSAVYANLSSSASFKNRFKRYNPAWNPTVAGAAPDSDSLFVDPTNWSNPTYGELGNSPSLYKNWRNWATPSENASLLKKTHFGADNRFTMTLRAEFSNIFNRHYWYYYANDFSSPYFGHVSGVSGNRTGQLGARLEW